MIQEYQQEQEQDLLLIFIVGLKVQWNTGGQTVCGGGYLPHPIPLLSSNSGNSFYILRKQFFHSNIQKIGFSSKQWPGKVMKSRNLKYSVKGEGSWRVWGWRGGGWGVWGLGGGGGAPFQYLFDFIFSIMIRPVIRLNYFFFCKPYKYFFLLFYY